MDDQTVQCPALVSCKWLHEQMTKGRKDIRILDSTFTNEGVGLPAFEKAHIESAQFFDLTSVPNPIKYIPANIPTEAQLQEKLRAVGVNNNSHIVVYESAKYYPYAGPRLWFLIRAFGHRLVSVLDGGLVRWQAEGLPVTTKVTASQPGNVTLCIDKSLMMTYDDVSSVVRKRDYQILDTRPHENYTCKEEEPSTLLRLILPLIGVKNADEVAIKTGTLPGAKNLPYPLLYGDDYVSMRPVDQLKALFKWAGVDLSMPLMTTCYTGFTACQVAIAASLCGNNNVPIYYGSWLEYGQRASDDEIVVGPEAKTEPPIPASPYITPAMRTDSAGSNKL